MPRFRWLVAGLVITGGAPVHSRSDTSVAADSCFASLPDSLSLANAATFEDTLRVLERSLAAFDVLGESIPKPGVFAEMVAAVRDSYAAGDVEAASILSDDVWEIVRSWPR